LHDYDSNGSGNGNVDLYSALSQKSLMRCAR